MNDEKLRGEEKNLEDEFLYHSSGPLRSHHRRKMRCLRGEDCPRLRLKNLLPLWPSAGGRGGRSLICSENEEPEIL